MPEQKTAPESAIPSNAGLATRATWIVELNCTCPSCDEYIDLLDYADFWDGRALNVAETCTSRSRDVEVVCPLCDHEFLVDCEY